MAAEWATGRRISIHALRGEGDIMRRRLQTLYSIISIHALRGEGDKMGGNNMKQTIEFQSTPSVGRATF